MNTIAKKTQPVVYKLCFTFFKLPTIIVGEIIAVLFNVNSNYLNESQTTSIADNIYKYIQPLDA